MLLCLSALGKRRRYLCYEAEANRDLKLYLQTIQSEDNDKLSGVESLKCS